MRKEKVGINVPRSEGVREWRVAASGNTAAADDSFETRYGGRKEQVRDVIDKGGC